MLGAAYQQSQRKYSFELFEQAAEVLHDQIVGGRLNKFEIIRTYKELLTQPDLSKVFELVWLKRYKKMLDFQNNKSSPINFADFEIEEEVKMPESLRLDRQRVNAEFSPCAPVYGRKNEVDDMEAETQKLIQQILSEDQKKENQKIRLLEDNEQKSLMEAKRIMEMMEMEDLLK